PVPVTGLTSGVEALAVGDGVVGFTLTGQTCALVNGGVQCWGYNTYGQLGNNSTTESHVPVQGTGLTSGEQAIAMNSKHTCALVNGGVQCWGSNQYGQLGNNSTTDSPVPVQVTGFAIGVEALAVGNHTCALVNGGVQCWGSNQYGQLGNNSTNDS